MHSILVQIDRCEEMIRLEKKQIHLWSKRLHIALQCFKEYLLTLSYFDKVLSENTAKNFEDNNAIQIEILTEESKELLVTIKSRVIFSKDLYNLESLFLFKRPSFLYSRISRVNVKHAKRL